MFSIPSDLRMESILIENYSLIVAVSHRSKARSSIRYSASSISILNTFLIFSYFIALSALWSVCYDASWSISVWDFAWFESPKLVCWLTNVLLYPFMALLSAPYTDWLSPAGAWLKLIYLKIGSLGGFHRISSCWVWITLSAWIIFSTISLASFSFISQISLRRLLSDFSNLSNFFCNSLNCLVNFLNSLVYYKFLRWNSANSLW